MTSALRNVLLVSRMTRDTREFEERVFGTGGSLSQHTRRAVDRLVRSMKNTALWEKTIAADLCCGDNLSSALVFLKAPAGIHAYTNYNFVETDYSERAGMTGNGSTKYLDSGLNPVTLGWSASDLMLWCVTRTDNVSAGTSRMSLGSDGGSNTSLFLGWMASGSRESVAIAAAGASNSAGGSATALKGLLGGGTNGSRAQQFFRNGTAVGGAATATSAWASRNLYKFAINSFDAAGASSVSNRTLSAAFITRGLTAAEIVRLYNIVAEFEASIGRPIP